MTEREQARAEAERLRFALVKARAHTSYLPGAPYTLLAGLLQSVERIVDAALAEGERPASEPSTWTASRPSSASPAPSEITGETSDGYHTFNELYAYRKAYNALLFNEWAARGLYDVHKSWRHSDGEPCFGGGWFIVVAQTPTGQISNYYQTDDWSLFQVPERERGAEWDGHTPQIALERLLMFAGTSPAPSERARVKRVRDGACRHCYKARASVLLRWEWDDGTTDEEEWCEACEGEASNHIVVARLTTPSEGPSGASASPSAEIVRSVATDIGLVLTVLDRIPDHDDEHRQQVKRLNEWRSRLLSALETGEAPGADASPAGDPL
jgi:hypothetical protein